MANPNIAKLDPGQLFKQVVDGDDQSVRVTFSDGSGMGVAIAATGGDSILSVGTEDGTEAGTQHVFRTDETGALSMAAEAESATGSATNGVASGSVVISELDIEGLHVINLYSNTTSAITANTLSLVVQVSPIASGNLWFDTALAITPSNSLNGKVIGTALNTVAALRARVIVTHVSFTAGALDAYIVASK